MVGTNIMTLKCLRFMEKRMLPRQCTQTDEELDASQTLWKAAVTTGEERGGERRREEERGGERRREEERGGERRRDHPEFILLPSYSATFSRFLSFFPSGHDHD